MQKTPPPLNTTILLHVLTPTNVLRARSKHFCILETTYNDRNWIQACSLLRRWLESVTLISMCPFNTPSDRLTLVGGHRTQEEGGTALLVGIQADGSQEAHLACQVAQMASEVSQTVGHHPLSI